MGICPYPWIWHVELRRTTAVLSVQSWSKGGTGVENSRRKTQKIDIDTSSIPNPFLCAEFQRRLWAFAPQPGTAFLTMPRNSRAFY